LALKRLFRKLTYASPVRKGSSVRKVHSRCHYQAIVTGVLGQFPDIWCVTISAWRGGKVARFCRQIATGVLGQFPDIWCVTISVC
jgi:hypothetical protein